MRVGLVVHPERSAAVDLARTVVGWLAERGHQTRLPARDAALVGHDELGVADDDFGDGLSLVVCLGGDGTMLRSVDMVATADVPVLGVQFGQLGYLAEVEPEEALSALAKFEQGEHGLDTRMLLDVAVQRGGGEPTPIGLALNEAVVEKTPSGHTVRLEVVIDGAFFTTYAADGLILATPTGSTAYALSARGPIVAPTHRAISLTPVSPHMLFDRTLVLDPTTEVRLTVAGDRPATVSIDGRNLGLLDPGDSVVATASTHSATLVRFGHHNFHQILKTKFGLSDR